MSLLITVKLPIESVLAIQDAAKLDSKVEAAQIVSNLASQAVIEAVTNLPYDITPKASTTESNTATPNLKRGPPPPNTAPIEPKKPKTEPKNIKIYVKRTDGKIIVFIMRNNILVSKLKLKIEDREGISPVRQRLLHWGKHLDDDKTLDEVS